jgi:hypothetical protein
MRTKYLIIVALLATTYKPQDGALYHFDPQTTERKEIYLSELADDVFYIPLDNSFPIGLIYEPKYFNKSTIYLSALNSGVMAFDRSGKFQRKIGSIGRGPGEYAHYFNFSVDEKSESVYVMIGSLKIIKVYSKTGNFLRDISLKEFGDGADRIGIFNSHLFISSHLQFGGARYDWIILDTVGNLVKRKERTIPMFESGWLIGGGLYKFDNKICLWSPFNDTVFSIQPDFTYQTSFLFSNGKHRLPRSHIDIDEIKLYFNPYLVLETKSFFMLRYSFDSKATIALIDKNSWKSYSTNMESGNAVIGTSYIGGIINDLDGGLRFQPENYFVEGNREYLVGLTNAFQIKALLANNDFKNYLPKYPLKKKELESLAGQLAETDNQILMIVRLKK